MNDVFICDAIRMPIGRYGGALAAVRADDLGALPIRALMVCNPSIDWAEVDDVSGKASHSPWNGFEHAAH